jgi:hypothetical protein
MEIRQFSRQAVIANAVRCATAALVHLGADRDRDVVNDRCFQHAACAPRKVSASTAPTNPYCRARNVPES